MSRSVGFKAEEFACDFLKQHGLVRRASNFSSRVGEIDLIMQDGVYLVFVEVRSRRSDTFGSASETVTLSKQQKIIKTALVYLQRNKLHDQYPIRFDVVSLQGEPPKINWLKNAFGGA